MSAPNAGRQSPEPENAKEQTESTTAEAGDDQAKVGAAPTDTHSKDTSEENKESVLSSNPEGPLEHAAQEKISKDGRGEAGSIGN